MWVFVTSQLTIVRYAGAANHDTAVGEMASPRSLFIQNCARCHGSNGKAQTALGRKLEAADLTSADVKGMSSARITRAIKNGRPNMPAFGKKLTTQQIASIVRYVRTL